MSQTIVTIDVGGTGANTAAGALISLGAAPAISFDQSNTAVVTANIANTQATVANTQANFARAQANAAFDAANTRVLRAGDTMTGNLNVAALLITQNVIPDANITYDLGSSTARYKDLWLSNSTIHLGEATISAQEGAVSFGNATVQLSNVTSKLNVTNDLFVSGNVGIGTANPDSKFHVYAGTNEGTVILAGRSDWTANSGEFNVGNIFGKNIGGGINSTRIKFDGDDTTGSISFWTANGGSLGMRMHIANGNIGIGTITPTAPLQIVADGQGSVGILNLKGNNSHLGLANTSGTFRGWYGYFNTSNHGSEADLNIKTGYNGASNIRISADGDGTAAQVYIAGSTGNVGIGTTSPANKLHVQGDHYVSGNVGIGITNPDQPLAFVDSLGVKIQFNGTNNNGYQVGLASSVNGGDAMMKFTAGETGAGEFGFYNTTNLRLLIANNGNVGIGTTSPTQKLHVEDGSMLLGDISGGSTSTPSGYKLQFDNSFAPGTSSTSYAPKIAMHEASGWLGGFGISDSHVDYFSGAHHRWFTGSTATSSRGTERLKIWSSGYVTMPTQTMISARHTATETPAGGTALLSWTIDVNQGGGSWNAGTGAYTVPVAGRYMVTCSLLRETGGAAGGIILHKNGASVNRMFYVDNVGGVEGYEMGSGQLIVDCGAGDSLRFMNENTVGWYGDSSGLGSFTINLLG